jgi:hypothetical protein
VIVDGSRKGGATSRLGIDVYFEFLANFSLSLRPPQICSNTKAVKKS